MTWFRRSTHPEEELSAYVDGELGERARRAVEAHLASCEACSMLLSELQDTKSLVSELPRATSQRSFRLGMQYAAERPRPAAKRASFSLVPAVALSLLVALLFVDAANFSSGGSSNDESNSAASTGTTRQAEPEAGLAIESAKADEQADAAGGGAASSAPSEGGEAEDATAAGPAPTVAEEPQPAQAPQAFSADATAEDAAAAAPAGGPEDTQLLSTGDSSDGLSTLRILEIVTAIAFVASLAVVVVPRFVGRRER